MLTNKQIPYIPLFTSKEKFICSINFSRFAILTVSLPLLAFVFCVLWSLLFNFAASTYTHCDVPNYLPSISAAVGNHSPQKYVWKLAIAFHAPPRFLVNHFYYLKFQESLGSQKSVFFTWLLHCIENISLVGLSFFSSSDFYPIHEKCFVTFIATSIIYMMLSCWLTTRGRNYNQFSLKCKRCLLCINLFSFIFAGFFFIRHNLYCEAGVYTLFALSEYIVVLSNMAFHMTAFFDFRGKMLQLSKQYSFTLKELE